MAETYEQVERERNRLRNEIAGMKNDAAARLQESAQGDLRSMAGSNICESSVPEIKAHRARLVAIADRIDLAQATEAGWQLVPLEPTPTMIDKGMAALCVVKSLGIGNSARAVYDSMLIAAAPAQESEGQG